MQREPRRNVAHNFQLLQSAPPIFYLMREQAADVQYANTKHLIFSCTHIQLNRLAGSSTFWLRDLQMNVAPHYRLFQTAPPFMALNLALTLFTLRVR